MVTPVGEMIILLILGFVFGCVAMFWALTDFFRRFLGLTKWQRDEYEQNLQRQAEELKRQGNLIKQKKVALRKLYNEIHHGGQRKATSSILGLVDLYWRQSKSLRLDLAQLHKPGHHRYAEVAVKELDEMDLFITNVEVVARHWHTYTPEQVKEFEHLQE